MYKNQTKNNNLSLLLYLFNDENIAQYVANL